MHAAKIPLEPSPFASDPTRMQVAVRVLEDERGDRRQGPERYERRVRDLKKAIQRGVDWTAETGLSEDSLALQINRHLDTRTWNGTQFTDRAAHLSNQLGQMITNEVEKSLMGQETYELFEARMLQRMGVVDLDEPLGPLRDMDTLLKSEAKIAWNEGMLTVNAGEQTQPVWRCALRPTSTAGCVRNHGRTIDEIGAAPLAHWGCWCDVMTIPDPDSADPAIAEAGKQMLAQMAAERDAHQQQYGDDMIEAARPSRFAFIRRVQTSGAVERSAFLHPALWGGVDGNRHAVGHADAV